MTNAIKLSGKVNAVLERLTQISVSTKRYFLIQSNSHISREGRNKKKRQIGARGVEDHFLCFLGLLSY